MVGPVYLTQHDVWLLTEKEAQIFIYHPSIML